MQRLRALTVYLALILGLAACNADAPPPQEAVSSWFSDLWTHHLGFFLVAGLSLTVLAIAIVRYRAVIRKQLRRNATILQQGNKDVHLVGSLLMMLYGRDEEQRAVAATALTRALPRLESTQESLLDTPQRANLHRALNHPDRYLVCAALAALEKIGDATAIPSVERLATEGPDAELQSEARTCLRILQGRAEADLRAQVLLRPASSPSVTSHALLRPAQAAAPVEAQQYLRASVGGSAEEGSARD